MLGLNSLASAIRGGLWLVRRGGLRQRLDDLECRTAALERLTNQRLTELANRFDALDALGGQLARLDQRTAILQDHENERWSGLGKRLDALARDLEGTAFRAEERLSGIADTVQGGYDHGYKALCKVLQIDDLLRSRSRVFGHEMFLDPTDSIVSPLLLRDGYFEPYETTLIESEVKPGDVVLDIGANIGYYTLIFARLVGEKGRVYAFEPDPTNFRLLKKNVRANGYQNVIFVNKAVAESSGPLSLYLCPDNKGDHRIFESEDDRAAIPIEATTLDEHFAEYQGKIDFIKMDIQGSEGRAVRGMQGLLRKHRDVKIITEFWPAGLRRSGVGASDYLADLEHQGFRLFRIDEDGETTESTTTAELLSLYPDSREEFSNLYCARSA